ncbi:MAG TPA: TolC family protein [Bacteroidales bacterium]|nr:TolC family protein [Bacteroidales bacterium]
MKIKYVMFGIGLLLAGTLASQETMQFSLQQAQDFAMEHNFQMQNARYDVNSAELSVWETLSAGLPQVNASAGLNDNLKLMTTLIPAEMFGGPPGTYAEIQFGTQFNTSWGVQASQLLFNGPVIVGVQTAKVYQKLAEQGLEKTEKDIRESVANTYYLMLVSEEAMKIIEGNIRNLEKTLLQTNTMYTAGMAEATDVDQIQVTLTMMENTKRSMLRNIELNYNLLRFQLGLTIETQMVLTEKLEDIMQQISVETMLAQRFIPADHIEMQMMETQENLAELSLKAKKAQILPTLAGFYSYNQSGQGDELFDQSWFPSSMLGLSLDIPILAGGQRRAQISKAKVELEKARTTRTMLQEQMLMQERQLRFNLKNAVEKYSSEKENVLLAKRILDNLNLKFEQGIISSLELTQANNNYLQAENNYISAMMEVINAKLALDKLLNNI